MTDIAQVGLRDGTSIPALGFGTFRFGGDRGVEAITSALDVGYRLLDTSALYDIEELVGQAVRRSSVPRDDLVVTAKLLAAEHGFVGTIRQAERTLRMLGLDRIDLYLLTWPALQARDHVEEWRALIDLQERGDVRSIGVSNLTPEAIDRLIEETGVTPAVHQLEYHPYFSQEAMHAFHRERGIVTQAWSPLARHAGLLEEPLLVEIGAALGVSAAQVVLRWHVQQGIVPVPKAAQLAHQRENLDVFGFELLPVHLEAISSLQRGRVWGTGWDVGTQSSVGAG